MLSMHPLLLALFWRGSFPRVANSLFLSKTEKAGERFCSYLMDNLRQGQQTSAWQLGYRGGRLAGIQWLQHAG